MNKKLRRLLEDFIEEHEIDYKYSKMVIGKIKDELEKSKSKEDKKLQIQLSK